MIIVTLFIITSPSVINAIALQLSACLIPSLSV